MCWTALPSVYLEKCRISRRNTHTSCALSSLDCHRSKVWEVEFPSSPLFTFLFEGVTLGNGILCFPDNRMASYLQPSHGNCYKAEKTNISRFDFTDGFERFFFFHLNTFILEASVFLITRKKFFNIAKQDFQCYKLNTLHNEFEIFLSFGRIQVILSLSDT